METVHEEVFYRPKSSLAISHLIEDKDISALSRALFNSNQMNLLEKTHETDILDKETGEITAKSNVRVYLLYFF